MNRHIIGIAGKARTGKDTIASCLVNWHGYRSMAFAEPITKFIIDAFAPEHWYLQNKEEAIPGIDLSYREIAQRMGTDFFRNQIDKDIWVKALQRRMDRQTIHEARVVITDVRFENEAKWIRDHGGFIIHVDRQDAPPARTHSSEDGIAVAEGDYIIDNNGTIDTLYRQIDELMEAYA